MPERNFNLLQSHIDEFGILVKDTDKCYLASIEAAESLCNKMLGCKLIVKGKSFYLTELEIYYGGVGDKHHDWHRKRYKENGLKQTNFRAEVINQLGYKIYISQAKISEGNKRVRMDIVVGNAGVPISFLVRDVYTQGIRPIPGPNIALKEMGFTVEDHGKEISTCNPDSDFYLDFSFRIPGVLTKGRRVGINGGIEDEFNLNWNRALV
jgi:hypothetical protein